MRSKRARLIWRKSSNLKAKRQEVEFSNSRPTIDDKIMSADLSSYSALVSLQNELGRFVIQEHAAQRETIYGRWELPIHDRVEEGYCISDLRVTGQPKSGVWTLECPFNDSRFREGDFVRLS